MPVAAEVAAEVMAPAIAPGKPQNSPGGVQAIMRLEKRAMKLTWGSCLWAGIGEGRCALGAALPKLTGEGAKLPLSGVQHGEYLASVILRL